MDLKLVEQLHISPEENNKPLKAESKQICEQTGALLHPVDDIATYVEAACLNPDLVDTRTWQCAVRVCLTAIAAETSNPAMIARGSGSAVEADLVWNMLIFPCSPNILAILQGSDSNLDKPYVSQQAL